MTTLDIQLGDIPPEELDDTPRVETPTGDYDSEFPGSTEEAPYGYKPDGTPYKRRPNGAGKGPGTSGKKSSSVTRNEGQARAAAALLARMNLILAMALYPANLPKTAEAITDANGQFEEMAYQSLVNDPTLCRKILSAGTTGGKTGLIMAYGFLGLSAVPAIRSEIQERKLANEQD